MARDDHKYGCVCASCEPPVFYDVEPIIHEDAVREEERENAS